MSSVISVLPSALHDHFPGQMDDFWFDDAAIIFLAEVDYVAMSSRIEDDTLIGQKIGVHQHFHVVQIAEGGHGAEIAIGEQARKFRLCGQPSVLQPKASRTS